jgi:lipoate-protein ligase A
MERIDLTTASPPEFLAWEEAFLADAEEHGVERLWFWESPSPCVVVGYGQSIEREVNVAGCLRRGIPILRRSSGGGTVVQGAGCLSYGLALRLDHHPALASVTSTNQWVMKRQANALRRFPNLAVIIRGHTDLAVQPPAGAERKFSGNAQRRTRNAILFHGTVLCEAPLDLISELLLQPSAEPEYRAQRTHADFVTNLYLPVSRVRQAIVEEWEPTAPRLPLPESRYRELLCSRYLHAGWHQRREPAPRPSAPSPPPPDNASEDRPTNPLVA